MSDTSAIGEVYLAEDIKLDRKVAIKFLNDEFSKDADKLNRFIQETKPRPQRRYEDAIAEFQQAVASSKRADLFVAGLGIG